MWSTVTLQGYVRTHSYGRVFVVHIPENAEIRRGASGRGPEKTVLNEGDQIKES